MADMSPPDYEYPFDPTEQNNTAASVYRMAAAGGARVLDVGSGPGIVAAHLQQEAGRAVTCVDQSGAALEQARARGVGRTVQADLTDPGWIELLGDEQYDVVMLADVLEHLVDPGALLEQLAANDLVAPGGFLVISIPNAAHEAVIGELLAGRFTYQETGLLDATHLRFFTLDSIRELLERRGFYITHIERTKRTAEQTTLSESVMRPELRHLLAEQAAELQTFQFILRVQAADAASELADVRVALRRLQTELETSHARPDHSRQIAELESEVAALNTQLDSSRDESRQAAQRLRDCEAALLRERSHTAAERNSREKLLSELEVFRRATKTPRKDAAAKKEVRRLERELGHVYRSRTWRVGRFLWHIYHFPGRLLRSVFEGPDAAAEPQAVADLVKADERADAVGQPTPGEYVIVENTVMRHRYQDALERKRFSNPESPRNLVMTVYTNDLDEGRGDVYVAVGLGRYLERLGYEVIYLSQARWYELPVGTAVYVAMHDWIELASIPASITRIAWVRNRTETWVKTPWLPVYDMVLCSSSLSRQAIQRAYPGPTAVLPLAVDSELFSSAPAATARRGVVSTANHWGSERTVHRLLGDGPIDFPLGLYGQDRGVSPALKPFAQGPVPFFSLPSLYSQAAVVLDDLLPPNAPYGNTNSRLFEAIACGATVLTNQVRGLDEIGLGEQPVFRDSGEMHRHIRAELQERGFHDEMKRLRAVVLEKHTYAVRAEQFDQLLLRLDRSSPETAVVSAPDVVGFYPDYRDGPYQEMMWTALRAGSAIPIPIGDDLDPSPLLRATRSRRVLHLNWTAPILGPAGKEASRVKRYRRFLAMLDACAGHNIPSIWTVHNVLPHECADPEMESRLRQEIADRVDLIHVMCERTVAAAADHYTIPQSKVRVLPHPGYVDVYPNLIDQDAARYEFGMQPDETVYLFLGKIRHYKGVDLLLDAFERLHRHRSRSRLIIAGQLGRFPGRPEIEQRARAHKAIVANLNSISDVDIQLYMNAADVVVLPYREALNSGAMMLAYSFARPVIVPDLGCLPDVIDEATGIVYSPDDGVSGLYRAMLDGERLREQPYRAAALRRASDRHYLTISQGFADLVQEAWSLRAE